MSRRPACLTWAPLRTCRHLPSLRDYFSHLQGWKPGRQGAHTQCDVCVEGFHHRLVLAPRPAQALVLCGPGS